MHIYIDTVHLSIIHTTLLYTMTCKCIHVVGLIFLLVFISVSPLLSNSLQGMTNKRSLIEPALLRPGRFEVQIEVPKPKTVSQRVSILNVHMKNMYEAGRVLVRDAPDGTAASRRISVRVYQNGYYIHF
jgi:hypothetical protein